MKKVLSILLALAFILSFATLGSCAQDTPEPTQAPATAAPASAPTAAPAAEPTAEPAAEQLTAGGVLPTTQAQILLVIMDVVKERLAKHDIPFSYVSAEFDNNNIINAIENYVTMGIDLVVVVPMDTSALEDTCLRAESQGTRIIMLSSPPKYEISGGMYSDYYAVGTAAGKMTAAWVHQTFPADTAPDSVPVCLSVSEADPDAISRTTGFREVITDDPWTTIAYEYFNAAAIDQGYTCAEEALTSNPDIRTFLMYDCEPAIGVDNYIKSIPNVNLAEWGVFAVSVNDTAKQLIEDSKTDKSAYRGIIGFGGAIPGEPLAIVAEALLTGTHEAPYWFVEENYTLNGFGWELKA